jgi:hypothetical protein
VGADPGKNALITAVGTNVTNEYPTAANTATFRYTQNQRMFEGKVRKYRRYHNELVCDTETEIVEKDGTAVLLSIKDIETRLSLHNGKTVDPLKYVEYLKERNRYVKPLMGFYVDEVHRKNKWNAKINVRRSEDRMINRFKEKFGQPKDTVLLIGDWEQRQHMKFKEPSLGVGLRNIFRRHHFKDIYLIDEFRTSCRCFVDGGENEKFKYKDNPRKWKRAETPHVLCHGLLRCKTCNGPKYWNRDVNGALNMWRLGKDLIDGKPRAEHLSRQQAQQQRQCAVQTVGAAHGVKKRNASGATVNPSAKRRRLSQ